MCGIYRVFQKWSEKVHTWQTLSAMCEPISCTCWSSEPSRIRLQPGKPPPLYYGAGVSLHSTLLTKWSVCTSVRECCPSVFQFHGRSLWWEALNKVISLFQQPQEWGSPASQETCFTQYFVILTIIDYLGCINEHMYWDIAKNEQRREIK